jgi:recombination protein RecA
MAGQTTKQLEKQFAKVYGKSFGGLGYEPAQIGRCPTGIFQYDLASGGGYPRNKLSIDYGPESSGKRAPARR